MEPALSETDQRLTTGDRITIEVTEDGAIVAVDFLPGNEPALPNQITTAKGFPDWVDLLFLVIIGCLIGWFGRVVVEHHFGDFRPVPVERTDQQPTPPEIPARPPRNPPAKPISVPESERLAGCVRLIDGPLAVDPANDPPRGKDVIETGRGLGLMAPPRPESSIDPLDQAPIPVPVLSEDLDDDSRDPKENQMGLRVFMDDDHHGQDGQSNPADITVREAFTRYLLPSIGDGRRAKSTTSDYFNAIRHWEDFVRERASTSSTRAPDSHYQLTVADSVYRISDNDLNMWGLWLVAEIPTCGGEGSRPRMSVSTAGKQWKKLRAILRRCGPRGTGNPKGEGLIEFVPSMDPLSELIGGDQDEESTTPVDLTDAELGRLYLACDVATWPELEPQLQWRTYIVICSCLGPRVNDASILTAENFSFEAESPMPRSFRECESGWLVFQPNKTKRHKGKLILPMPPCVRTHVQELLKLRGGRLFGWPGSTNHTFRDQWTRIVEQAGLPHVKRKHMRSTCTNRWNRAIKGLDLGDWVLGHAKSGVNAKNYQQREGDLIAASSLVSVPDEFKATLSGVATQPFLF